MKRNIKLSFSVVNFYWAFPWVLDWRWIFFRNFFPTPELLFSVLSTFSLPWIPSKSLDQFILCAPQTRIWSASSSLENETKTDEVKVCFVLSCLLNTFIVWALNYLNVLKRTRLIINKFIYIWINQYKMMMKTRHTLTQQVVDDGKNESRMTMV